MISSIDGHVPCASYIGRDGLRDAAGRRKAAEPRDQALRCGAWRGSGTPARCAAGGPRQAGVEIGRRQRVLRAATSAVRTAASLAAGVDSSPSRSRRGAKLLVEELVEHLRAGLRPVADRDRACEPTVQASRLARAELLMSETVADAADTASVGADCRPAALAASRRSAAAPARCSARTPSRNRKNMSPYPVRPRGVMSPPLAADIASRTHA